MRTFAVPAVLACCALTATTQAKTLVFPHALESSGSVWREPAKPWWQWWSPTAPSGSTPFEFEKSSLGPAHDYYTKKHIGNVKYESFASDNAGTIDLFIDISDIDEEFVNNSYKTTFAILLTGTASGGGESFSFFANPVQVTHFDTQPLDERTKPFVVTIPDVVLLFGQNTLRGDPPVAAVGQIDAGMTLTILPAPSAAVVFGAGALVAARRRRA